MVNYSKTGGLSHFRKYKKILFEVFHGLSGCAVYVFEDENGFFIEQPYNGIFSIEEKQYTEIFGFLS